MKSKNVRFLLSFTMSALLLSTITPSLLCAQNESRIAQARATLEEYADKSYQSVTKIIRCTYGAEECTKSDITQARSIVGIIGAALAVLAVGKKRFWPFGKRAPQPAPAPTIVPEEQPKLTPFQQRANLARALVIKKH